MGVGGLTFWVVSRLSPLSQRVALHSSEVLSTHPEPPPPASPLALSEPGAILP